MNNLHIIGSPPHVVTDAATSVNQSPVKGSDPSYSGQQIPSRGTEFSRGIVMSCLRQLVCKVVLTGLEHDLKTCNSC
jgi:mediator of RNA polymerase II transcription subunit 23